MTAITFSESYRHCFQEITSDAVEQASARLSSLLGTIVTLSKPNIEVMTPADIAMALHSIDNSESVSGVCQGFIGGGISGEGVVLFHDTHTDSLLKLLNHGDGIELQSERELLMDTTNVLLGAYMKSIGEQIDINCSYGPPKVLGQNQRLDSLFKPKETHWKHALVTEINYTLNDYDIHCDLLLILTEDSINLLCNKMDYLLS